MAVIVCIFSNVMEITSGNNLKGVAELLIDKLCILFVDGYKDDKFKELMFVMEIIDITI